MQRFETKYDLLHAAYKDPELKKGTIALLQYLVHKSNKEQCFPSVDTIAKALGVCRRTVQYNMRKLERAGYIIRKDRYYNHVQSTNQYVFYFGITEDKPGKMKYSDQEYEELNASSFNIPDRQIRKIDEIQKIYRMELTAREKLLLVYLYHRANKKGIVYDSIQAFMGAIGVKGWALQRILNSLREKGLVKIKKIVLHGQAGLVMQLTGKVYHAEELEQEETSSSASATGSQEVVVMDGVLLGEFTKSFHDKKRSKEKNSVYGKIWKRLYQNNLFQIFKSALWKEFCHIQKVIREILRI
ncbi:MAG: helix-turn-helix domain-containing protein [Lachnospiraceae bacterium]|nr:helix-turn-helix domain-containing protein [Lachnospiraceae bacterium]